MAIVIAVVVCFGCCSVLLVAPLLLRLVQNGPPENKAKQVRARLRVCIISFFVVVFLRLSWCLRVGALLGWAFERMRTTRSRLLRTARRAPRLAARHNYNLQ